MDSNRLFWDTPITELQHSDIDIAYVDLDEGELMHWKYIKREKLSNGRWRYYYDKDALKSDVKNATDKAVDSAITRANRASGWLNNIVDKAKEALGNWYNNPDNMYDVSRNNYAKKVEEIKQTDEWKSIVANADKEYVKKNKDGTTTYLIDDYIVDKKHPVLDAISDIASGRDVTLNEISRDTVVAGLKDYASTAIELGLLAANMMTNGLVKKFKYSQGSYDDDIATLTETAKLGENYVNSLINSAAETNRVVSEGDWVTEASNVASKYGSSISKSDVEALASILSTASDTARSVNEGNVIQAAQHIMESDMLKQAVGSNEYYKQAESVLGNLTEEEIMLVNLLIQQMRSGN